MFLESLRAWHAAGGGIPAKLTVLIEGEEEVGSVSLDPFLTPNKADLSADVALISDTGMWDAETPAITTRLRGMTYAEVTLKAANRDLHSGIYGGSALNPINALTRILGELQDENGRIQLPGFYDSVVPISNSQRAQWDALGFDEAAFLSGIGLTTPVGGAWLFGAGAAVGTPDRGHQRDLGRLHRRRQQDGDRVGGIGQDFLPAGAGQDPDAVMDQFRQFVTDRLPPDATATFADFARAPGIEVNVDSAHVRSALDALAEEYGKPALLMGCGGSIPVATSLRSILGLDFDPDGLRAGGRSSAQPEREVRRGVLSPGHTFACSTAGEIRRRIDWAGGADDAVAQNPCICGTPGRYTGCLSVIAWLTGGFSRP